MDSLDANVKLVGGPNDGKTIPCRIEARLLTHEGAIYSWDWSEMDENKNPTKANFGGMIEGKTFVPCPTCRRHGDFNLFVGTAVEKIIWEGYPEPYNALRPVDFDDRKCAP